MKRPATKLAAVGVLALAARSAYRLAANGALTLDLGVGERFIPGSHTNETPQRRLSFAGLRLAAGNQLCFVADEPKEDVRVVVRE